jgi:dienelactone hydrolase
LGKTQFYTSFSNTSFNLTRYCFGGKLGAELNAKGLTDATVLAHPSLITKADIDALKTPSTFALSELDHAFDESMTEYVQKTLKDKIPMEVVTYPGTVHGFASRGDLSVESVRKGSEGAMVQAVNWFKKYLAEEQIRLVQPSE